MVVVPSEAYARGMGKDVTVGERLNVLLGREGNMREKWRARMRRRQVLMLESVCRSEQAGRQAGRQARREAGRQAGRQTGRQSGR